MAVNSPGTASRPLLLSLAGSALLLASLPALAQGLNNMRDQLIIHYCTLAVNADFAKAGKTVPAGLAKDTCTCVAEQVNARATIPQAEAICKQQALGNYNLSP
ncbi:hypothetical protein KBZ12_01660 [Cyanobium sp. Cruz CV13-4-11]|uniref:hypothetical protein n=1 Tax=unclassified Cyanobium TaxID=2627006 RepID=UPI0020CD6C16|nr:MULTISPECIES: hypothetical protein [unclassified Cyanobium]MCP9899065.1 hypothetical protein [Cyanobium sp. Cruz CV11-17]MCP9918189.1 hypothetical protein [Cyanobium sp. Cruz CV13-4-11]